MKEQEQANAAPSEQTLDDVYKEFNVEGVAKSFNAAPPTQQAAPVQQNVSVPDPAVDIDGFQKWAGQIQSSDAELKQTLHSVSEQVTQFQNEQKTNQVEADIKSAVSQLQESIDAEPELLESVLDARARRDPKFRSVWENRKDKPEVLNSALKALGSELAKKFTMRTDPQLAENTRAMKASRGQMQTTQSPKGNEEWDGSTDAEFQQKWNNLVSG